MSSSSTENHPERQCPECNMIITSLSSSDSSPYCFQCINSWNIYASSRHFEVGTDLDDDENQESQVSEWLKSIPIVKISSSMLRFSSSEDSTLPCTICREDFVVGESARKLPCNHLYHNGCIIPWLMSNTSCPICRFELAFGDSDEDSTGLAIWFEDLSLEDDFEGYDTRS